MTFCWFYIGVEEHFEDYLQIQSWKSKVKIDGETLIGGAWQENIPFLGLLAILSKLSFLGVIVVLDL